MKVGWLVLGVVVAAMIITADVSGSRLAHAPVRLTPSSRLTVVAHTRGPNDPHDFDLSMLIPHGARLRQLWYVHGGRQPDQVLVEWIKHAAPALYGDALPDTVAWGLTLWTQSPRAPNNYQASWIGVAVPLTRVPPGAPFLRVALADVTSDGHPDVLVEQYPHTNHGCGPHEVISTRPDGTSWRIFHASLCETTLYGSAGMLALDLPDYRNGDSVCCPSHLDKLRLRWNGARYVVASDRVVRNH